VARNYKLQWLESSRRWRKQYRGKQYYFGLLDAETKASSYQRCLREWEAKKVEIDRASQTTTEPWLVELLQNLQETYRKSQDAARYIATSETLRLVHLAVSMGVELPIDDGGSVVEVPRLPAGVAAAVSHQDKYQEDLRSALSARLDSPEPKHRPWESDHQQPPERTVGALLDQFQESNPKANPHRLKAFRTWCVPHQDAGEINGIYCRRYFDYIVERVQQGKWSASYGKSLFGAFTQFVRWLYKEVEILEYVPRNIEDLHIETPAKQVEVFGIADVKRYLDAADDRLELYLLLMLNCGMTQIDIADLHASEVDWKKGRVTRKRSKTKDQDSVPVCTYFLWPRTFELLKKCRRDAPGRVLLTDRGTALVTRMNGKGRNDSIRLAYLRMLKDLDETGKPLLTFKKTSASLLNAKFGLDVSQLFLDHAPRTIAEKHYIAEDDTRLEEPLTWLREQYFDVSGTAALAIVEGCVTGAGAMGTTC